MGFHSEMLELIAVGVLEPKDSQRERFSHDRPCVSIFAKLINIDASPKFILLFLLRILTESERCRGGILIAASEVEQPS